MFKHTTVAGYQWDTVGAKNGSNGKGNATSMQQHIPRQCFHVKNVIMPLMTLETYVGIALHTGKGETYRVRNVANSSSGTCREETCRGKQVYSGPNSR